MRFHEKNSTSLVNRSWRQDLLWLMLITCFSGTAITIQMGVLSLYVKSLGGSNLLAGIAVGMLGVSALIFRIPIGYLLDRFGRKKLLLCGLVILLIAFFTLSFWSTIMALIWLRFIQGIGNSIQSTATGALASDYIPKSKLTNGLAYFSIAQTIPQALGPAIGLAIINSFGYRRLFTASFGFILVALLLSWKLPDYYRERLKQDRTETSPTNAVKISKQFITLLKNKMVLIPSGVIFLICLANSAVVTFIIQYAQEKGIANSSYYFLVLSFFMILARTFSSRIFVYFKKSWLAIFSIGLVASSFYLIAVAASSAELFIAAALYGLGYAFLYPLFYATVLLHVALDQKGSATAIFSASLDVAFGGGSIFWGIIANLFAFSIMYFACAFLCLLSGIVFSGFELSVKKKSVKKSR
jgi:MFS family permease